ncbi:hypothetical protein IQ247_23985 [Plectonema cf. radiosum LEGE 06105]|uniref:Uncharacterized protein n=2 Tax=Plectonema TaxID=1183 RepID=A0A8J7F6R6_9CYAN|nr:hypothetical protein [Plectonema cf. radiosum LEGE 06105]
MIAELIELHSIQGRLAIKLKDFKRIIKFYSESFLIKYLKRLLKKKLVIAYKYKKNWYIFLPKSPITKATRPNQFIPANKENFVTPSGRIAEFDWQKVLDQSPREIQDFFLQGSSNTITRNGSLYVTGLVRQGVDLNSSTVAPKSTTSLTPFAQNSFPATLEYKYGYYIKYNEALMSVFDPGVSGLVKSTNIPAAFFEICRALDAAENARNGANPGLPPQRNISTTVSFDTGTIAVAATIPVTATVGADGVIQLTAVNYLGATYGAFVLDGDMTSDTLPEAMVEIATLLSNTEKSITPAENQPDNVQVQFDLETGSAVISANLPFTSRSETDGAVTVIAIDYL